MMKKMTIKSLDHKCKYSIEEVYQYCNRYGVITSIQDMEDNNGAIRIKNLTIDGLYIMFKLRNGEITEAEASIK